tara:strand:- start:1066 stop:1170 length:105 start_codon:yes stop_codon:yes gene_type:complete
VNNGYVALDFSITVMLTSWNDSSGVRTPVWHADA